MAGDLDIADVRLPDGTQACMRIRSGRIAEIGDDVVPGPEAIDGGGCLALPGLVEAHTHLDKTFWGLPWQSRDGGGTILERIERERRMKARLGLDAERQATGQILASVALGTTAIRSHVDVDPQVGVRSIEGVMAARERCRDLVDIEIVAFPQWGLLSRPGASELMHEAMALGADVVGGLDPAAIDRDPRGSVDLVFALAERYGRPVDIHLHEPDELGQFTVGLVCERTRALGMAGRVTLSHAFCLGAADADAVERTLDRIAGAGVAVMTTGPSGWPAPSVARLHERGIAVCSGNDGIRDAWSPFGDADMLRRAALLAERNDFATDAGLEQAFAACSGGGAAVMGLAGHGLAPGAAADLILVEAASVAEAVATVPPRRLVVKRGRVVARDGQVVEGTP